MAVQLANGTPVTQVGLNKTAYVPDDPPFTINTDLYDVRPLPGSTELGKKRLARVGQVVRQSDIDRWYA